MMSRDEAARTAEVLRQAHAHVPVSARGIRAWLSTRAREHERVVKRFDNALDEFQHEDGPPGMAILPRGALEKGMTVVSGAGNRRLKAMSATGIAVNDNGYLAWEDGDNLTPFVVIDIEAD